MEHKVEEIKLKCGAKGLLIDVPGAPVAQMEVWFRGGDSYTEGGEKIEAAHLMEHLAFGANTKQASSEEVSRYVSKNGAWSNAHTSRKFLSYEIGSPDFDLKRIMKQLVVQVTTPKFLEIEFKSEFGNVQEEFRGRSNNKWGELSNVMNQKFGWTYSHTDLERLELMNKVVLDDIKEHYKRTHGPDNVIFFVAGNISEHRSQIIKELEGLKSLPKTKKFKLQKYPKIKKYSEPVVISKEDVPNIYFTLEMYAKDEDGNSQMDLGLNLNSLAKILSDGDHSRIYGKARKNGWIYGLSCSKDVDEKGWFSFELYCQVGIENIDKLIELIVAEYKDIKANGPSRAEVNEAVISMKGQRRMRNQTAGEIMNWYSGWYTSAEEEVLLDYDESEKNYDNISSDLIKSLFSNLIKTKKWGAGFLGNVTEAQAKKWNAKLAEIFED
jgi:predicted Zn-dependent peptidase